MNRKRSKLIQVMAVSFVVIGLLVAAWPGVAQNERPRHIAKMRDALGVSEYAKSPLAMTPAPVVHFPNAISNEPNPFLWSKIAYTSYRDNNAEIYIDEAYGSHNETRLTANNYVDTTSALDRGSHRVVFISNRDGNGEVYRMNADGSGVTRLTFTMANEYLPTWSPDGQRIVFYSYRDGNAEIYVMNADGSNQTRLTYNAAWDGHPAWSPDGQQLAFASQRTGNYEIFKMRTTGENAIQLTSGAIDAAYPDWSPDGSTILFNYDAPPVNGFYDVGKVSATGGTHTLVTQSQANTDHLAPRWDPTGKYYAYSQIYWTLIGNQWYWTNANITIRNIPQGADLWTVTFSAQDLYADWKTTDSIAPTSQVNALPVWITTTTFAVTWFGADPAPSSEIAAYDVQVRDGSGSWIDWQTQTAHTSANFTGQYGHTYYFRSRARDYANNLEAYPSTPDSATTVYQYTASGQILGNRDRPVAVTTVQTEPAAINLSLSCQDGQYDLYFALGGTYILATTRSNFGQLPPLLNVTVPSSSSLPTLYLPPLDNQISDSHFESGNLDAWNPSGDLTPTITSTAHTGNYAVLLSGSVPTDTLTTGPWHSIIEQTVNVSPTIVSGTLALLYRVESVEPLSDTLTAYVFGANNILTFTLPLTSTDWTHAWFDISAWNEPTATVKIDFTIGGVSREAKIILDEITWGSSIRGSHEVFLPIARR